MLNRAVFHQIVTIYSIPDRGLFISFLNHQVKKYVSWTDDKDTDHKSIFSQLGGGGGGGGQLMHVFPPFNLI